MQAPHYRKACLPFADRARSRGNICLLGGWATHQIVNKSFEKTTGHKYIGSRDIDISFHIDKNWTEQQLRKSEFCAAIQQIENMGFMSVSFRLVKDLARAKKITQLKEDLVTIYREEKARETTRTFTKQEIERVAAATGVNAREIASTSRTQINYLSEQDPNRAKTQKERILQGTQNPPIMKTDDHTRDRDIAELLWSSSTECRPSTFFDSRTLGI